MYFQSEAREWITTSNKLLNSRNDRQVQPVTIDLVYLIFD